MSRPLILFSGGTRFAGPLVALLLLTAPAVSADGEIEAGGGAGGETGSVANEGSAEDPAPFIIDIVQGAPENPVERFQRIAVVSLPFCVAYSYGVCYLVAAAEQETRSPDLQSPRDYKPYYLAGGAGLSVAIAIYDLLSRSRRHRREKKDAERLISLARSGDGIRGGIILYRF